MFDNDIDRGEFFPQKLRCFFRAVYAPVLSAGAAEIHRQILVTPLNVFFYRQSDRFLRQIQKFGQLRLVREKLYNFGTFAVEFLVFFVTSGVVNGAAVKDKASAVAGRVVRNASAVRKTLHLNSQNGFLRVAAQKFLIFHQRQKTFSYLRNFDVKFVVVNQITDVLKRGRNACQKVRLLLQKAPVTVTSERLQNPYQNHRIKRFFELFFVDFDVFFEFRKIKIQKFVP